MRFIQLTDLHLRDPETSAAARAHAEFVRDYLARVAATWPDAAFWVLSGDLADNEEPGAYRWLRDSLRDVATPTVLMCGNHDNRAALSEIFGPQILDPDGFVQSVLDTPEGRMIFLDTLTPGSDAGTLCPARLGWLEERLAEARDRPAFLFMHHPPCDIGDPVRDPIRLDNPDALAQVLNRAGNVRHIFFGHVHQTIFVDWNGIACTGLDRFRSDLRSPGVQGNAAAGIGSVTGGRVTIAARTPMP